MLIKPNKHTAVFAISLTLILVAGYLARNSFRPAVPMLVTIESPGEGLDPCGYARVRDAGEGKILPVVRSGPGKKYSETDTLRAGQFVWVCDGRAEWNGIVYALDDTFCNVTSPQAKHAYAGPCRSGWIKKRWLEMVAG